MLQFACQLYFDKILIPSSPSASIRMWVNVRKALKDETACVNAACYMVPSQKRCSSSTTSVHLFYLCILYLVCVFGDSYVSVTLDNPQMVLVLLLRKNCWHCILMIKGCSLVISVFPGYLQCFNIFLSFLFLCFLVMEIETLHNKIRSRKLFDFAFFYITNGFNYNFVRLPQASVDRLGKSV